MAMNLGQLARGRDNNLNLIRMIAATAVLVSHAFPIALGPGTAEPLEPLIGHSLGGIAVWLFFVISGFLISASFERSATAQDFWLARGLRIVPCLVVSTLIVALLLGPAVTSLPLRTYLAHPDTWTFLLRNLTLALPQYELPGVFRDNPYHAVVGSIWTLAHEVGCYVMVFLLGCLGGLRRRGAMAAALALYAAAWAATTLGGIDLPTRVEQFRDLSFPFAVGIAFWIARAHIRLTLPVLLGLAALAAVLHGTAAFTPALVLALAYATFWAAYVPGGWLRGYNRFGDYSYGLYLYAFPAQGLAVWLWGPMDPWTNIALSLPLSLIPSVLSWYLIEAPALALRRRRPPAVA